MSKKPKINIVWPPEKTLKYEERYGEELDFIIPLEDNKIKEESR